MKVLRLLPTKGPHPAFGHLLQQGGWRRDYTGISRLSLREDYMQSLLRRPLALEKVPEGGMRSLHV
jgi:hypothetical protein